MLNPGGILTKAVTDLSLTHKGNDSISREGGTICHLYQIQRENLNVPV